MIGPTSSVTTPGSVNVKFKDHWLARGWRLKHDGELAFGPAPCLLFEPMEAPQQLRRGARVGYVYVREQLGRRRALLFLNRDTGLILHAAR
ncbi:MAG: hypothetical protein R2724_01985 [Bryobacterales bacterium]